jgi:flagellar motor switch protein FliN
MGGADSHSFETLNMKSASDLPPNIDMFLDVPVEVTVRLGSCQASLREVLQLNAGSVLQLDKLADAPVDLLVNDKLVAHGEVVVIENRFGIKITQIIGG